MLEEFKTDIELVKYFTSDEIARKYLEDKRWGGKPVCPLCNESNFYKLKSLTQPYCCKKCRKNFSVRVGTIFDSSNVPLHKWLIAIWKLMNDKRSISSVQMITEIGVTQKTAWYMNHRIREMFKNSSIELLSDEVQVDETYVGGKKEKMKKSRLAKMSKGTGMIDKLPIVAMKETKSGKMILEVTTRNPDGTVIKPIVRKYVVNDAVLVTDGSGVYAGLHKEYKDHIILNHGNDEYVRDGYTTNHVEGHFRHLKDSLTGTFKGMVRDWHMQRYVNEFVYKCNTAERKVKKQVVKDRTILTPDKLKKILRYKDLVKHSLNPRCLKKAS